MTSEEGTCDVETDNKATLQQKMICLEQKYNRIRHELFNRMRSYYNQSIASRYITEDHLHNLIEQCREIKDAYSKMQTKLMSEREKIPWSFGDSFKLSSQVSQKENKNGNC